MNADETPEGITVRYLASQVPVSLEVLYDYDPVTAMSFGFVPTPVKRSRWRRLRYWWLDHKPHLHLGPCDMEEE